MGRWMIVMILVMRGCSGCLTRVVGDVGEDSVEKGMGWSRGLEVLRPWLVPELMRRSFFQLLCFSIVT
jgi:hypothetical protein